MVIAGSNDMAVIRIFFEIQSQDRYHLQANMLSVNKLERKRIPILWLMFNEQKILTISDFITYSKKKS